MKFIKGYNSISDNGRGSKYQLYIYDNFVSYIKNIVSRIVE